MEQGVQHEFLFPNFQVLWYGYYYGEPSGMARSKSGASCQVHRECGNAPLVILWPGSTGTLVEYLGTGWDQKDDIIKVGSSQAVTIMAYHIYYSHSFNYRALPIMMH